MPNTKTDLAKNQSLENKKNSDYGYLLDARSKTVNAKKENAGFGWLTEHSRNFLAAGYVAEGVKAEERIREIADRAQEILKIRTKLNEILSQHSGKDIDKVSQDTERDNFMSGDEAVKYGLIDKVIDKRDK